MEQYFRLIPKIEKKEHKKMYVIDQPTKTMLGHPKINLIIHVIRTFTKIRRYSRLQLFTSYVQIAIHKGGISIRLHI